MVLTYYDPHERVTVKEAPVDERLKSLVTEVSNSLTQDEAIAETKRCMSCGLCFDCGTCWSFCQDSAIIKPLVKGEPYKIKMEFCKGCKKCGENCPCGYIEMR
jgi:Pyruvate/2-oxoacid:ferredoxin oxidoreductase delta subunit